MATIGSMLDTLDVPTIVSQLIASESQPVTLLQNKQAAAQTDAAAYRALNTRFQSVLTQAQKLTSADLWNSTAATSSSSTVSVSSSATAQAGSLTFSVDTTAAAQSVITQRATPFTSTTDTYGASSLTVTAGGKTSTITAKGTGTGGAVTLGDMVTAINGSGLGLSANAVQTATGQFQLQVTATSTGTANAFSLSDGITTFATVTDAADAKITVGTGAGKYAVTSSTNTFTGVLPGATFTVSQQASSVTLSVASDPTAITAAMQSLVSSVSGTLDAIKSYTATGVSSTGTSSGSAGALAGDYNVGQMAQQLRGILSKAVGDLGSPSKIGLQLNSDGTLAFDATAFAAALKNDPATVKSFLTGATQTTTVGTPPATTTTTTPVPGIAGLLQTMATSATDSVNGSLVTMAKGQDDAAKLLQSQIDDWNDRLTARQAALTTQYSNLKTMLSTLSNQQSWLSSIVDQMSGKSSNS